MIYERENSFMVYGRRGIGEMGLSLRSILGGTTSLLLRSTTQGNIALSRTLYRGAPECKTIAVFISNNEVMNCEFEQFVE